jgi:NAD(P)-dependent dehydrogenase (short-subunit alcohol dehydrogenase family)
MLHDDASSGRCAQPAQIAEGVVMLASGTANWINGATIAIDGGIRLGP